MFKSDQVENSGVKTILMITLMYLLYFLYIEGENLFIDIICLNFRCTVALNKTLGMMLHISFRFFEKLQPQAHFDITKLQKAP